MSDTSWKIDIPTISGYTVLGYIYFNYNNAAIVNTNPEKFTASSLSGYARCIVGNSINVTFNARFLYVRSHKK